jgi:hypothetical protein
MTQQRFYKSLMHWAKTLLSSLVISAAIVPHVSAHLMVAQRGTLNFKGNSAFMVLSLPVSGFSNADDDGDGKMSAAEFSKHRLDIIDTVNKNVMMSDNEGQKPLRGLMLTPVESHTDANAPSNQLIIMGRFALSKNTDKQHAMITPNLNELKFLVNIFGKKESEKIFTISTKRKLKTDEKVQQYKIELTPETPEKKLFADPLNNK